MRRITGVSLVSTAVCAVLATLLFSGMCRAGEPEKKPNLLLVIADDCTFRAIGCYGGQAQTPNIDPPEKAQALSDRVFGLQISVKWDEPSQHQSTKGGY